MTTKNDEVFANFMMRLAQKIMERHEANDALAKEQADQYNSMMAAAFTLGHIPNQYRGLSPFPADFSSVFNPITSDELEVIRAYFDGEDVLTTILSQGR